MPKQRLYAVVVVSIREATVEGYTVMYGQAAPEQAFIAARLADDRRVWAITDDADVMQAMTEEEFCGRSFNISGNLARF